MEGRVFQGLSGPLEEGHTWVRSKIVFFRPSVARVCLKLSKLQKTVPLYKVNPVARIQEISKIDLSLTDL